MPVPSTDAFPIYSLRDWQKSENLSLLQTINGTIKTIWRSRTPTRSRTTAKRCSPKSGLAKYNDALLSLTRERRSWFPGRKFAMQR